MKRLILFVIIITTAFCVQAQISKVSIQASGLTCSMCSNAINKALKSVDYVDHVIANIKNSSFEIYFKPNAKVDFDVLKTKVEDAGFFVAKMDVSILLNDIEVANDTHVEIENNMFHFMNVTQQKINGEKTIQIIDKGFLTEKVYKKNAKYTNMNCYKTGYMESCCKKNKPAGTRIYHVTI
jgi:copper chaperone CopZ